MTDWFMYGIMNSFNKTSFREGCRTHQGFRNTSCYTLPKAMYFKPGNSEEIFWKVVESLQKQFWRPFPILPKASVHGLMNQRIVLE